MYYILRMSGYEEKAEFSFADFVTDKLGTAVLALWAACWVTSFITIIVQFFFYLKRGVWPEWKLLPLIREELPLPFIDWLANPHDWRGLHTIVHWFLAT